MNKILLALVLIILPVSAIADRGVLVGGWSKHFNVEGERNEHHSLLGYQTDSVLAGTYINSHYQRSWFIGLGATTRYNNIRLSAYITAVSGYNGCFHNSGEREKLCIGVMPTVSYERHRVQPTVFFVGQAIALSFRYAF